MLRTYCTCSYSGYQDTTTYAALFDSLPNKVLFDHDSDYLHMRKAIASSKSTSSALAAAWPSQLMVTRMVKSISSSESGDLGKNLGVEVLIWESHCSWEIVLLSGVAKSGKRQFENSCDEIITIIIHYHAMQEKN